ncbi:TPA: hypothetical protein NHS01_000168 [Pseudomonas aeruginosa]|uniref:hypothetical protein n=1 Tax=Pseudomonas aeruginosa TaxID=287 RepID=UPI0011AFAB63|nr:hypothetical protein [Pseudomonas aeruginosa]MBG3921219.1 hypothetical protein [Pseudomonas aeruginosa]MBG6852647.1 hypothetical protein [Pseudomonas aeruginosa]MBG7011846.1 hypothetical protein [Pseudomonas aeruginosa]MBG7198757.1 hypothetical protein [Pseudomonas aeruginosa]MBG7412302.1 hypothetical protein [Pseudomonas aeruginosa]
MAGKQGLETLQVSKLIEVQHRTLASRPATSNAPRPLRFSCAFFLFFLPISVLADEKTLQAHCMDEWTNDKQMRAYCVTEQRKAAKTLAGYRGEIKERCEEEWLPDFEMTLYCVRERRASKKNIERNYSGSLRQACEQEWDTEYEMVEHCIERGE